MARTLVLSSRQRPMVRDIARRMAFCSTYWVTGIIYPQHALMLGRLQATVSRAGR